MNSSVLLRIKPSLPDPKQLSATRGPLMMESVLSTFHSLKKENAKLSLELGTSEGKIGLFIRTNDRSAALIESQLYGQYPEAEIERDKPDLFEPKHGEVVYSCDLTLGELDGQPIKRHPQFIDLANKQHVDSIAGITSALVRFTKPGMRGHIHIALEPLDTKYRKRAGRIMSLLSKGLSKVFPRYGRFLMRLHMARGVNRVWAWPLGFLLGNWRARLPAYARRFSLDLEAKKDVSMEEKMEASSVRTHDREDVQSSAADKLNRLLFAVNIRISVIAKADQQGDAEAKLEEIISSFRQFSLPQSNEFEAHHMKKYNHLPLGFRTYAYPLSVEEVATIWHLPTVLVQTPNLDWVLSKKLQPPINLPIPGMTVSGAGVEDTEENLTVLGEAAFRGARTRFGIRPDDRRRHIYVIGKTGMGKSTILQNMVYADIQAGRGVAVIDPHGDLVESIMHYIPKSRSNDVVLFDPADRDYPISFNILECKNEHQRPLVASGIMSVFTKLWPDVWSGRMEHILRNTLLALLENEGSSMLGIIRMFGDDAYRVKVVSRVTDPLVKSFWEDEYANWEPRYRTEAVAAIQNKIGQLLSTPLIRNIVGQVHSTLDIREAMDTGKIILVNLSKGKLGEDTSAFLGSMLVTKFQIDAMGRADIPEKDRRDFYLYVDEFQNFATESFATILSEARKYRLSLTMANQYVGQLVIGDKSTKLKDAVFGNVGSLVSFQVGSDDAEVLSLQFEEAITPKDILSLPKYHAYIRLMIDGVPSKPFSVLTLAPPKADEPEERLETLRRLSRERYAEKRSIVEEKISRWAASAAEARASAKQDEKAKEKGDEEKKKARAKGMSLEEYRKWRDRELWTNEFNSLRKKKLLGEELSPQDEQKLQDYQKKLEATGGVPPVSKALQEQIDGKKKEK